MFNDKMDYIFAIAEEQNLTHAAKRLFIAQSTLTMYLNRLESELGMKLFDRSKSPILPTPAGQLYIKELKKIQEIEKISSCIRCLIRRRPFGLASGL